MILHAPDLAEKMNTSALILDTCVLVLASKIQELKEFLHEMRLKNCVLIATSSVHVELLRGARNLQQSSDLEMLFGSLGIVTIENVDAALVTLEGRRFMLMVNKSTAKNPVYVDMQLLQLATCLRVPGRTVKLMTANFKDVPNELFNCEELISTQNSDGLQTVGIYSVKQKYFAKRFTEIK